MHRTPGTVDVDSKAPAFRARDVRGRAIATDAFPGRSNLVLFFYRSCRCQTCREELADLVDKYSLISGQAAEVIAISTDGVDDASDLAVDLHLPYPVISDPDADLVRLYGAYDGDTDTAHPTLFVIDGDAVVRYRKKIEGLDDLMPAGEVVDMLKDLNVARGRGPLKPGKTEPGERREGPKPAGRRGVIAPKGLEYDEEVRE